MIIYALLLEYKILLKRDPILFTGAQPSHPSFGYSSVCTVKLMYVKTLKSQFIGAPARTIDYILKIHNITSQIYMYEHVWEYVFYTDNEHIPIPIRASNSRSSQIII